MSIRTGKKTKNIIDRDFRDIFLSQIVSVGGGWIAGTVLAIYTNKLLLIPGMLILLPGFLEMRGSISGSCAARLSSGLFVGAINPEGRKVTKLIRGNVVASFFLAMIVSLMLGLLAYLFTYAVLHVSEPVLILIPVIAGMLANAIEIPLTVIVTLYLFRKGHDPNNIIGPFITSTGDITSIVALLAALLIL